MREQGPRGAACDRPGKRPVEFRRALSSGLHTALDRTRSLRIHIDLDTLADSAPRSFTSTVCILGGGIAGLILATRLAAAGVDVHLLEAGGLEQEERSQQFYATEQPASEHRGSTEGRFRTFGGSSTRWGGQLLSFTPDIFKPGPGCPSRPWPIEEEELAPFYKAVEEVFAVDALPFDAALLPSLGHPPVSFSPDIRLRFSKWAPFKKRNLARTIGVRVLADTRIRLYTHANVAGLEGDGASLQRARVLDYAGREFHFHARHFVMSAGTVESSRILLNSPGVPNPHDRIGRGFHDHLTLQAARFTSPQRERILERLGPFFVNGTLHTCKLEASTEARERERLLAVMAHVVIIEPEDSGTAAIRGLLRSLQAGKLGEALLKNAPTVLRSLGEIARLFYEARVRQRRAVSARAEVLLNIDFEQPADPENRIRLSERRDALGIPMAVVDWRIREPERETASRFAPIIRRELDALDLAPAEWHAMPPPLLDTYHAMGGLCMGTDPASSVVDPDLKVHQLENLHIASCAVFPSGSSSNPTFTMMALTMRLAAHLVRRLGEDPSVSGL